ncbi:aminotransferase class III-fold pyridoxal phosphate-dependent enzyme, partial [Paraburkholderia tropica]
VFEEEQLLAKGRALGAKLHAGLEQIARDHAAIGTVRGLGPMAALEFVRNSDPFQPDADFAQAVIDQCREDGLLVIKCGVHRNTLRLLAPLTVSDAIVNEALTILRNAVTKVSAKVR